MTEITLDYVTDLAIELPAVEQQQLIERLKLRLASTESAPKNGLQQRTRVGLNEVLSGVELERKPRDLYGIWQGKFPADLDLEKELYEIRHEWEKELEEFGL